MKREFVNAFGKTFLKIQPDLENNWIHIIWKGYLSDSLTKEGAIAINEALQESGFSCVLNDMLQVLGPIRSSDWAVTDWAPQVAKIGLKHMAMVTLPNAIAVPDVSNFHTKQTHFQTEVFNNLVDAKEWLRQHCMQPSS